MYAIDGDIIYSPTTYFFYIYLYSHTHLYFLYIYAYTFIHLNEKGINIKGHISGKISTEWYFKD